MSDQTISFLKNPYSFISEEAGKRKARVFETRLLLRKTLCMTGAEAAALFYNPDLFMRKGASPSPLKATLFQRGGVQDLDGVAHRRRKDMLMNLLTPEKISRLGLLTREILRLESVRWSLRSEISFYEESQKVLTEAVCQWAGIPLEDENISQRAAELSVLRGRSPKAESWITSLIKNVREGKIIPEHESPLAVIASFKDHRTKLLDENKAAVELLNILRPAVAVSVYMVFIAHALSLFPEARPDVRSDSSMKNFLQEVRRYYPFFPATVARVKKTFNWKSVKFTRGERVMLDIFGTNHDDEFWERPEDFNPSRFLNPDLHPFAFIPQGGGDVRKGHRCPGEEATMEIMKQTLLFLNEDIDYMVPAQDLMIDFHRTPALPASHFRLQIAKLNFVRFGSQGPSSYYNDSSYHFSHL